MFHQLICTTIIRILFIEYILTHFIKTLGYIEIQLKQLFNNLLIDLSVFVVHLLFADEMQVVG